MVEKGRESEREGEERGEERRVQNQQPCQPYSHTAIRYFTVFGVHPLSARFEREIHIYVNEEEAGRPREEGRKEGSHAT